MSMRIPALVAIVPATLAAAGCGGSGHGGSPATTPHAASQPSQSTLASPGGLQGEGGSAATGDIPDNQVFLVFRSPDGWSMKYPEGWVQAGTPSSTVFRDKNNIVRVSIQPGAVPPAGRKVSIKGARIKGPPSALRVDGRPAVKVVYTTVSTPNAVTGKSVTLTVDRYYVAGPHKLATIDLGTPEGVDNVDAYRLMSESFRWR